MTIDERLKALTLHLELLSLGTEKHDELAQLATLVTEITEGTTRLLTKAKGRQQR
jgi:hypothetical protein